MASVGYSWLALLYTVVLLLVLAAPHGPLAAVMRWPTLVRLGRVSYMVYLLHQPVLRLVFGLLLDRRPTLDGPDTVVAMAVALVATVALAALSWVLFERRVLRYGHSFRY
jgi:peptidoglycan/LPS O-acetylase OafA/YrhL